MATQKPKTAEGYNPEHAVLCERGWSPSCVESVHDLLARADKGRSGVGALLRLRFAVNVDGDGTMPEEQRPALVAQE